MLASGVDLTDQDAVDQWIAEFNARLYEDRDEVLGSFRIPDYLSE